MTAARGFATPESGSTLTVSRTDDDTDIRSVDLDGAVQPITFLFVDRRSPTFSPNVRGVVVDEIVFRFSISGSIPEIFAIKVENCQKSRKILDGFLPSQILGGRPSKNCTHIITPSSRHVVWIKICDDIPISPDVIDLHTLNFKPNLSFVDQSSRSFFFQRGRGGS